MGVVEITLDLPGQGKQGRYVHTGDHTEPPGHVATAVSLPFLC